MRVTNGRETNLNKVESRQLMGSKVCVTEDVPAWPPRGRQMGSFCNQFPACPWVHPGRMQWRLDGEVGGGNVFEVRILEVDKERKKISLSMKKGKA